MEKLAVGPRVNPHMVSLLYPIERNLRAVASALDKPLGCSPGLQDTVHSVNSISYVWR